jgi:hypothetical protein
MPVKMCLDSNTIVEETAEEVAYYSDTAANEWPC